MDAGQDATRACSGPVGGGRFAWRGFILWLPACLALGVPLAWAAVLVQDYYHFAPLIIFPLLVGAGLGALAVALMRAAQVGNRPTVLSGVLLAVAVSVVGQHYLGYRAECKRVERQIDELRRAGAAFPKLVAGHEPKPPATFVAYMQTQARMGREMQIGGYVARGWVAWLSWVADGLLVLVATLAMVIPAVKLPFCNCCGSWYRVIRSGRVDGQTAARLARLVGARTDGSLQGSARYRVLDCNGGCGPASFELSWQERRRPAFSVQAWLDAKNHDQVTRVLREGTARTSEQDPGS